MFLYIIRHGEPDYTTDTLTALGRRQAEALSERFESIKFDKIFSSPMGRARQTASPTCEKQQKDIEILPWLSEGPAFDAMKIDIGGKTGWWYEVLKNTQYLNCEGDQIYYNKRSRDFYLSTVTCFDNFLSDLGYQKCDAGYHVTALNDDKVAVFCHAGISRIILSYALSIPFNTFCASFWIPHTGVTVLHFEKTGDNLTAPRCFMFSDLSHLYSPEGINYEFFGAYIDI